MSCCTTPSPRAAARALLTSRFAPGGASPPPAAFRHPTNASPRLLCWPSARRLPHGALSEGRRGGEGSGCLSRSICAFPARRRLRSDGRSRGGAEIPISGSSAAAIPVSRANGYFKPFSARWQRRVKRRIECLGAAANAGGVGRRRGTAVGCAALHGEGNSAHKGSATSESSGARVDAGGASRSSRQSPGPVPTAARHGTARHGEGPPPRSAHRAPLPPLGRSARPPPTPIPAGPAARSSTACPAQPAGPARGPHSPPGPAPPAPARPGISAALPADTSARPAPPPGTTGAVVRQRRAGGRCGSGAVRGSAARRRRGGAAEGPFRPSALRGRRCAVLRCRLMGPHRFAFGRNERPAVGKAPRDVRVFLQRASCGK